MALLSIKRRTRRFAKGETIKAGGYSYVARGMTHYAYFPEETVIQLHDTGPQGITYVNPAATRRRRSGPDQPRDRRTFRTAPAPANDVSRPAAEPAPHPELVLPVLARAGGFAPRQPPYRYLGSHSVMPGHIYMMTMQTITMNM